MLRCWHCIRVGGWTSTTVCPSGLNVRVERGRSPMDLLKTSHVSWNKVLQSLSVFTGPLFWDRDSSVSETQGQTFDNMKDITLTTFVMIHPSSPLYQPQQVCICASWCLVAILSWLVEVDKTGKEAAAWSRP